MVRLGPVPLTRTGSAGESLRAEPRDSLTTEEEQRVDRYGMLNGSLRCQSAESTWQ
jgi:hypothetical protein